LYAPRNADSFRDRERDGPLLGVSVSARPQWFACQSENEYVAALTQVFGSACSLLCPRCELGANRTQPTTIRRVGTLDKSQPLTSLRLVTCRQMHPLMRTSTIRKSPPLPQSNIKRLRIALRRYKPLWNLKIRSHVAYRQRAVCTQRRNDVFGAHVSACIRCADSVYLKLSSGPLCASAS
jgi:hypothetical protein